jgi:putative hemolysin
MILTFQILALLLLLFCSAFFSSSEVALFSLSSMKVKAFKTHADKRKQLVSKLLSSPRDLLVTIIMFNIIINILIQNVTSSIFGDFSGWALNVAVPLALTLVFGEVIPKSIGMANNLAISYRVAPFLEATQRFFLPIRKILIALTGFLSRLFFFFLKSEEEISLDEMQHALKASRHYGILNEDEAELVRGYLNLKESQVKELMRPREEVLFYDLDEPLSKLIHLFVDQECSRIPVCKQSLDNVVGVITSQAFFIHREKLQRPHDLSSLLQKPLFVPEAMSAEVLLRNMYHRQESLALVVDEYGSISGLIALEDLVERVIGQIADARDEKSRYTRSGEDVIIASGKLELSEFEEIFGESLTSENNVVTIGGWLTERMGDIPKTGTKCTIAGFLFHVLAADAKRVRRVYIRKLKSTPPRKKEEK